MNIRKRKKYPELGKMYLREDDKMMGLFIGDISSMHNDEEIQQLEDLEAWRNIRPTSSRNFGIVQKPYYQVFGQDGVAKQECVPVSWCANRIH